jgi:hypothetical protein
MKTIKTILENVEDIDFIINKIQKIDAYIFTGKFILAFRENRKLLALFEREKASLLKEKQTEPIEPTESTDILENTNEK